MARTFWTSWRQTLPAGSGRALGALDVRTELGPLASVLADIAASNTPVGVVARDANKLDIFVAGDDGKIYTVAWDSNVASGQWRGWWNILTGAIPAGGAITAVARHPSKLDIFIVSTDGGVYTAAWDSNVAGEQWRGWWRIG